HNLLLQKEKLDLIIKKYSAEIQAKKSQAIFEWIILALKPFKVIEEKAFRNMIQRLDPFYKIPGRRTIQRLAINQFNNQRNLIKNYFSKISTITIHFIDENWNLQHFILDIFQFKGSHTGESIANKVYSLLEEFKIETKVIALTTDN
ncbi:17250_t:CDS:2, partial [Gigaspora rosea]